ncbi:MAG: hypothetical protein AB7Q29_12840 [Vicinamibacterales bacterium]
MLTSVRAGWYVAAAAALLLWSQPASANPWNEKTVLTFSAPVMVPGATLEAGTYVFRIAQSRSARHVIRIMNEKEDRLVTTVNAIPMYRNDASQEIVVKFAPTESGPPAMKGWFYPDQRYGHEFIYPENEARQIAERTKTMVLAGEGMAPSDPASGTLEVIDADGKRSPHKSNPDLDREWNEWNKTRPGSNQNSSGQSSSSQASSSQNTSSQAPRSTPTMVQAEFEGMRVNLDELEDHPMRYIGKRISVDGAVDEILGPRIFKIDEPNWGDLEGELLVLVPANKLALLSQTDKITVSGTVRQFVQADVEREWGWFGGDPDVAVRLSDKPVIVADRIIGGSDQTSRLIEIDRRQGQSGQQAQSNQRTSQSSPANQQARSDQRSNPQSQTDGTQTDRAASAGDSRAAGTSGTRATGDNAAGTAGRSTTHADNPAGGTATSIATPSPSSAGVGAQAKNPISNVSALASADEEAVGRPVRVDGLKVTGLEDRGFFVQAGDRQVFVLSDDSPNARGNVTVGDSVSLDGFVMEMPNGVVQTLDAPGSLNRRIYLYATSLNGSK